MTALATETSTGVGVIETHISSVFLTADRAYKLLKPVEMPFLDFRVSAERIAATDRELALNRRIAPDVYLGTADVREDGELVDRMIVMRRLPASRSLSALVDDPSFPDHIRSVARAIAAFHSGLEPVQPAEMATNAAVRANWNDNFDVIDAHVGTTIDRRDHDRARALVDEYLTGTSALFDARIRDGFVRDGHGDLIADDIFCLDDGPRIIDCLAFNDAWRTADVLCDIAFLAMDIERLAGPSAAASFVGYYLEFSALQHPQSLAHHYIAYRAHVRAKVALLRYEQGDAPSAVAARTFHRLALRHLERGRLRMILIGGGPGVGKSTVARDVADHFGYPVLATDDIRKDLTATPHDEHRFSEVGGGIYDAETTDRAYGELLHEAELLLDAGVGVVLDASWSSAAHRRAARVLATRCGVHCVEMECTLDAAIAKERVARRLSNPWNPSDATPEIVDALNAARVPWPTALRVPTGQPVDDVAREAIEKISRADRSGSEMEVLS